MRNFKSFVSRLVAVPALLATAGAAFAQAVPATPTTAVELAKSVDLSDAKSAGLIIVGLLIALGVVLWGARMVEARFKAK